MAALTKGKLHYLGERMAANMEKQGEAFKPHATTPEVADTSSLGEVVGTEWVDVDLIDDNPYQYRDEMAQDDQRDLVEDMNANGQLQEGAVRPHPTRKGRWQLIWAHRRKYGVKDGYLRPDPNGGPPKRIYANAGSNLPNPEQYIGKLRVRIYKEVFDLQMRKWAHSENTSRVDPKPLEVAKFYRDTLQDLTAEGRRNGTIGRDGKGEWKSATQRDLAAFLGIKLTQANRMLRLLALPEDMQKAIADGHLNANHGRALNELAPWPEHQRSLYKDIRKAKLSGEASEAEAIRRKNFLLDRQPNTQALEQERQEAQIERDEAKFDPDAEKRAQERRAEIASVMRSPEEAAAAHLGGAQVPSTTPLTLSEAAAQLVGAAIEENNGAPTTWESPVPNSWAGIAATDGERAEAAAHLATLAREDVRRVHTPTGNHSAHYQGPTAQALAEANERVANPQEEAGLAAYRAMLATQKRMEQGSEPSFEGVSDEFAPERLVVAPPAPVETTCTNGVVEIPRVTELTRAHIQSANKNLHWASTGFDILRVATDDIAFFEEQIAMAANFVRALQETLGRHKQQNEQP